jgi:hypothetical protein
MSTPTYDEFMAEYPEMDTVLKASVESALNRSNIMMLPTNWGERYAMACGLLTAHNLTMKYPDQVTAGRRKHGMAVGITDPGLIAISKSASVGGLSESSALAPFAQSKDPFTYGLSRTEYGLELLTLMQMWLAPGRIVLSPDTSEALGDRAGTRI